MSFTRDFLSVSVGRSLQKGLTPMRRTAALTLAASLTLGLAACNAGIQVNGPSPDPAPAPTVPTVPTLPPVPPTVDPVPAPTTPAPDPAPVGAQFTDEEWETILSWSEAYAIADFVDAEQYTSPNSPAMGYVVYQQEYLTAVAQLDDNWKFAPGEITAHDQVAGTVSFKDIDGDYTYGLSNFVIGPDGLVSSFANEGGQIEDRLVYGGYVFNDDGTAHIGLGYAYKNSGDKLMLFLYLTNWTDGTVTFSQSPTYTGPDGVALDYSSALSHADIGPEAYGVAILTFDDAEFGGTLHWDATAADGTALPFEVDVPAP